MRFGSVCSGIEAASVAWHPLGWQAAWLAEIEPFPSAVLKHHYSEVPNHGDMTLLPDRIRSGEVEAPDLFCGGTPCQAFSVAGKRQSLADARGNLSLTFCDIADAIDESRSVRGLPATIVFWENVPGVLSTKDNAFGCFLAQLCGGDEPLYAPDGWPDAGCVSGPTRTAAWRILDAQYFGLAQRRKRVFVVASARDGFDPAEVLFEWQGVRRDTAPSREKGQNAAPTIAGCSNGGGANGLGRDVDSVESLQVMSSGQANAEIRTDGGAPTLTCLHEAPIVAHALRGEGFDASEDGTGRGTPLVPVTYDFFNITAPVNRQNRKPGDPCHTLARSNAEHAVLAFHPTQDPISSENVCHSISSGNGQGCATAAVAQPIVYERHDQDARLKEVQVAPTMHAKADNGCDMPVVLAAMQVRRLTPVECERLQGFPDGYTAIPWRGKPADQCPDGPRYKALGNSWAVPVVRWIGKRIHDRL